MKLKEESELDENKGLNMSLIAKDKEIEPQLIKIDDFRDKQAECKNNTDLLSKLYDSGSLMNMTFHTKFRRRII